MIGFFKPAAHKTRLQEQEIDPVYKKLRWQIFLSIFVGYAGYYLVRKNFSLAMPYLIEEQGFTKGELGFALSAVSIAYGLSKFLMGNVSDRSNPRYFLMTGLLLSSLVMFIFGFVPWATQSIAIIFLLLFINGWVQGMGWPACGRTIVHWYSGNERGQVVSVWNIAHNVGGGLIGPLFILGMAWFNDWRSAFYVPAAFAALIAGFVFLTLRDTPQSCGLPPIEEHRNDYPLDYEEKHEQELSAKEIFVTYVLNNKLLWFIAIANAFVYLIRYGVLDWAPLYLSEVKDFSFEHSSWAYLLYEWAGIPGTLLCGYISDKWFKGRRSPAAILYMVLVLVAVLVYWFNPAGNPSIDMAALMAIGFLIYGPVMLIGLYALELVPKKAAGTAAGLTGLFGYLGGAVIANIALGFTVDYFGWNGGFVLLTGGCICAIVLIGFTVKHEIAHLKSKEASAAN
ncbi:glycerol-3-phosphate transporter [Alteromonas sp. KS69]|jgi:OPA family glycerol-3-phosphate transporter-like MFS transporter|uniref:glycerol-3-phosphate transporter n=1 Tax=unclassified Alteromonas TaxID=2614992 RepID=UPI000C643B66|nr:MULTISPECIES: glycerol-3-phosphate transporter [unclassified Alteromonas]MBB66913.1 glycerol-3-phosphate transporter [Rickettsiales bacterium]MBO7924525.1 glycerol-3-phosphate transporter [Alteromonas sp. K632G]RUP75475.1 glycerol-3-phosphate transporter [Alteromonas sp. KS69]VEL96335.1 OPA family glycerol-3-phosphate transporter-like MFS transporter [Alteromonas sp. 76-1]|tara:strand:+ start:24706 stop:26064 length:1359 start_codon:yes stop_codon:yes gene_type:complete